MSVESVKEYFKKWNIDNSIIIFPQSSATVELAAKAANVIPARIAKTLSLKAPDGKCILIVTSGDTKIDNQKFKLKFGFKAVMLKFEEVFELTGHHPGGVCPFAISNHNTKTYIDKSVLRFSTSFPAAGSSNSAIELCPDDLFLFSNAVDWVDVAKFNIE
ncbi:MAG: YbaK/EbsC family protein [Filifactoraceae bacterium]